MYLLGKYSNIDYSALKPMEAILLLAKQKMNVNQTPIFVCQPTYKWLKFTLFKHFLGSVTFP